MFMKKEQDDILVTKESTKNDWLNRPGVTGMGVGFKYVGGKRTKEVVICLFVRKKLKKLPSEARFPKKIGKYRTDVI